MPVFLLFGPIKNELLGSNKHIIMDRVDSCGGHICQHCGKRLGNTWSQCERCNDKRYCNVGCGEADWSTHKGHCRTRGTAAITRIADAIMNDNEILSNFILSLCYHWGTFDGAAHLQCYVCVVDTGINAADIEMNIMLRRGLGDARDSSMENNLSIILLTPEAIEHAQSMCSVRASACYECYKDRNTRIFDLITSRIEVRLHVYGEYTDVIIGRERFEL